MSDEIFKWQPSLVDYKNTTKWNVVHSQYENGAEQRGLMSSRELNMFSFTYKNKLLNPGHTTKLKNEIRAFFNARNGSYDNFFVPSWQLETKITEAVTTSDNTFKINKDPSYLEFSYTACDYGNYIHICNTFSRGFELTSNSQEIRRILSWELDGDDWIVTVDSTFDNNYSSGAYVQKAMKAFFANDSLPETFNIPYVVELTLDFKEDLGNLYQSTFGE